MNKIKCYLIEEKRAIYLWSHLADDSLMWHLAGNEQTPEEGAAGWEDKLVGVECLGLCLQDDISEGVGWEKVAEELEQLAVVTPPL